MTAYLQECDGELNAVITNAIIFEAAEVVPGVELKNRFFTENAAWDTGSFFLTNIDGNSRFYFRLPAEGKAEF